MLGTEELHSATVGIYNGNLGGLTVLTTMIICKSGIAGSRRGGA
jgi:hypothetical protein